MTKKNKNEPFKYHDHAKPVTRRDFLAQGFLGIGTVVSVPTVLDLVLANPAYAAEINCSPTPFTPGMPYLCMDGAGGMNIAGGNVMVGFRSGGHQLDFSDVSGYSKKDYFRLGLPEDMHPVGTSSLGKMTDNRYGLIFHKHSGMLEGMDAVLDNDENRHIIDHIDGFITCVRTADDTGNNQLNTAYMARKAGAKGQIVDLVGNQNSVSGGRSIAPSSQIDLTVKPSKVSNFEDAKSLLSIGDKLMGNDYLRAGSDGGQARIKFFLDRIKKLSRSKLDTLANLNQGQQVKALVGDSQQAAADMFEKCGPSVLGRDADVDAVFNDMAPLNNDKVSSVAKLVLDGFAGAATITVGGCDYHNGTSMRGHMKDYEVGVYIAQSILLAAKKEKDLFIHLFTDGGVTGDSGGTSMPYKDGSDLEKVIWTSDSGTRSASVVIVYKHNHNYNSANDPVKANDLKERNKGIVRFGSNGNSLRQIGSYKRAGGVNLNSSPIANNLDALWKILILNYLEASTGNGVAEFERIWGRGSLPDNYESMIVLNSFKS